MQTSEKLCPQGGVFNIHEPIPTIRGVNRPILNSYRLHNNDPIKYLAGVRPLTAHERSLIQTFPGDCYFGGAKTSVEQMLGNGVPVNLARYIGECIMLYASNCHKMGKDI